jgi:cytoskeletal protein CcmA (bactofilin family)
MVDPLQSFLDQGTSFEGKIAFTGTVRIDGHFKGEASSDGALVVGETGSVEADLELKTLVIQGHFKGSVMAKELVEIAASGSVDGDIFTPRLRVAEGAQLRGSIHMGESRLRRPKP